MKRENNKNDFERGVNLSYLINKVLEEIITNNLVEDEIVDEIMQYDIKEIFSVLNKYAETYKEEVTKLLNIIGRLYFYVGFSKFCEGEDISYMEEELKEALKELRKKTIKSPSIETINQNELYEDFKDKVTAMLSKEMDTTNGIETTYQEVPTKEPLTSNNVAEQPQEENVTPVLQEEQPQEVNVTPVLQEEQPQEVNVFSMKEPSQADIYRKEARPYLEEDRENQAQNVGVTEENSEIPLETQKVEHKKTRILTPEGTYNTKMQPSVNESSSMVVFPDAVITEPGTTFIDEEEKVL